MTKTKITISFPTEATWQKLLMRWSDFPKCGEKLLICAVIASAITYAMKKHDLDSVINRTGFFGNGLDRYCHMIGLDGAFVCEQVMRAAAKVGDVVEIPA